MTKADIINKIVEDTGLPKKDVSATVEAFMEEIRECMAVQKENVYLRGFGTFTVKRRAQKTARNISKNTTMVIEAHDIPAFKPCKSFLKDEIINKQVIFINNYCNYAKRKEKEGPQDGYAQAQEETAQESS